MTAAAIGEADFIRMFETQGALGTARSLGVGVRSVYERRTHLENKIGRQLVVPDAVKKHGGTRVGVAHPQRLPVDVNTGVVLVGSDLHAWPGPAPTAHRAFCKFASEMAPKVIVMNGDVMDGARISRHPPINWEDRPSLIDEIGACKERLAEVEQVAPAKAVKVWTLGNHDARFETRLATVAPEYARIHGVHLKDHFPGWKPTMSLWLNSDCVIKHRHKNGIHATHNSTLWAGKTMVTGHLHSLKVTPFTDYSGTRWGVDTGCLADPDGPQFAYGEDNPTNHRSGFIVLTFHKGRLLWPEIVHVIGPGEVEFRGSVIRV